MQLILVLLTFTIAAGYLLKRFVWNPISEGARQTASPLDGKKTKCGKTDCGC